MKVKTVNRVVYKSVKKFPSLGPNGIIHITQAKNEIFQ